VSRAFIGFANVLLTGLVAGAMFGIWLGFDPRSLSPSTYVEQQQNAIRALNVAMPVLGAICIVLTIAHAILVRTRRSAFRLLLIAALSFVIAGVVTRFGNQPINATVMTWRPTAPPARWAEARDQWWRWHIVRTIAGVAGFICVIAASGQRHDEQR
jgi:uncharacterized membrane protein